MFGNKLFIAAAKAFSSNATNEFVAFSTVVEDRLALLAKNETVVVAVYKRF